MSFFSAERRIFALPPFKYQVLPKKVTIWSPESYSFVKEQPLKNGINTWLDLAVRLNSHNDRRAAWSNRLYPEFRFAPLRIQSLSLR